MKPLKIGASGVVRGWTNWLMIIRAIDLSTLFFEDLTDHLFPQETLDASLNQTTNAEADAQVRLPLESFILNAS